MGEQFGMGALFDDPSLVEDDDLVGGADAGQPVGDDQQGTAGGQRGQRPLDRGLGVRVGVGGGLVEHQHRRVGEQRPGDGDPLRLTAGEGDVDTDDGVVAGRLGDDPVVDVRGPRGGFDFGVAVSLDDDALGTAVIEEAETLAWPDFVRSYDDAVAGVRAGRGRSKACTPLILTSMGAFNVRDAQPVVVPPAIGTLFVGEAHYDHTPAQPTREVVSLCLSFDHRWLNGVAGAQFLRDVVHEIEHFAQSALA